MSENYAALRAAAALTPEEQAKSDAFEHSDGNRRELEMAIAAQSDPEKAAVLRQQYAQLFEGAPRAPDARPSPTPDDGPPSLSMLMAAYRSPSPTPGPVALAQQQSRGTPSLSELMEAYNSGGPAPAPPPDGSSDFVRGFKSRPARPCRSSRARSAWSAPPARTHSAKAARGVA
jgi:hypothetical protein